MIEDHQYSSNGNLNYKFTYEYDDKNNVIRQKEYESDKNLADRKYTYEYDDKGNWIKQIKYINNAPYEIIERTIEYY